MSIANLFSLLGGLGLFLYGMQMMSEGLEAAAGNKMKAILKKITSNRFIGLAAGAIITAIIQSSSATTVMVVGFVSTGMMTLTQAMWIIMGANIGTTITGQLIALDIGTIAPLFAFIGAVLILFINKSKSKEYGKIIAGLGIIFIGMKMISTAMLPLSENENFISIMTSFENPVLGIGAGALFTAVIQSSAASIGILQALASTGVITLKQAIFVLFGQNIGTCITAAIASIGANKNAKRTTVLHLSFNIIGTAIFTLLALTLPLVEWFEALSSSPSGQIANVHTIFNIVTTILLLPFGTYIVKLAEFLLPDTYKDKKKKSETKDNGEAFDSAEMKTLYINTPLISRDSSLGDSIIIINNIKNELKRMAQMTRKNIYLSFKAIHEKNTSYIEEVQKNEDYIDYLNKEISKYISHVIAKESNEETAKEISALFKVSGNLERISDHTMNVCDYAKKLEDLKIEFSSDAKEEILKMQSICSSAFESLLKHGKHKKSWIKKIEDYEQNIDDMRDEYSKNQISRMHKSICSDEACILYSELLTDFERIGDHILNIGQALTCYTFGK